jgi:hypothetical protein
MPKGADKSKQQEGSAGRSGRLQQHPLGPMSKRDLGDDDDWPQSGRKLRLVDPV